MEQLELHRCRFPPDESAWTVFSRQRPFWSYVGCFCECERAVGSCGSWSRCYGVHSLSTMKQCCIFVLKCVRSGLSLHWCVFFVWAILWAQSKQCVPPRLLKCTLRTTGGFNPQLELPFLLYLTYNELFSFSFSLFSLFLSHFISTHSVSDQEPGKLPVDDPSQRRPPLAR